MFSFARKIKNSHRIADQPSPRSATNATTRSRNLLIALWVAVSTATSTYLPEKGLQHLKK
jgi:hypothetical protein